MDAGLREVLDLVFRWLHVVAGIMWIGNSMLFNWLDRKLVRRPGEDAPGEGRIWLLHSGGFYEVRKTMLAGQPLPVPLHWFKWQAYTTWLSGAALLVVVYYLGGGALLLEPERTSLDARAAVALGVGTLAGGWILYDQLWKRVLGRLPGAVAAAIAIAAVLALGVLLTRTLSGRAAFLHLGAALGTLMAGNVFFRIIPAQRQQVAAVRAGEPLDQRLAGEAKLRSIHNNYLTLPVVALMLSGHAPALYAHRHPWLVLAVILLGGATVRHLLNVRFTFARWRPVLALVVGVAVAALALLVRDPAGARPAPAAGGGPITFAEVNAVVQKRCAPCHSASPSDRSFGPAPAGVAFDTPAQIRAHAERILARAVESRTMPPANRTWITDAEREVLRRWVAAGAPLR